jgi:hypothetical protein
MQANRADEPRKILNLYDLLVPELKFSPHLLLTLIPQIYFEKIASDRVRERQDNEPLDFPPCSNGMSQLVFHLSAVCCPCLSYVDTMTMHPSASDEAATSPADDI